MGIGSRGGMLYHIPVSLFSSQKHHHTTTEIKQHSNHDDGSAGTKGGEGSMGMGAWGWEHGDGNMMIQWDNGVYSFVLFVICCYLFHPHNMLLRAVFGIVFELFFCSMF